MNQAKLKKLNVPKYIKKLKKSKSPEYLVGRDHAMALKEIYHPGFDRTVRLPKVYQISEFHGTMKEGHKYLTEDYKNLLFSLKDNDAKFSSAKSVEERVPLAQDSLKRWVSFFDSTAEKLKGEEDYQIKEDTLIKMEEMFGRHKRRDKLTIQAEEVLPFHNEFARYHRLDIPIHPKNLAMLLHPHWGYLCKFTKKEYSFKDIVEFYRKEIVSSYFRDIGRVFNSLNKGPFIKQNHCTELLAHRRRERKRFLDL